MLLMLFKYRYEAHNLVDFSLNTNVTTTVFLLSLALALPRSLLSFI